MIARKFDCDIQQLSAMLACPLDEAFDANRQSAVTRHLDQCPYCRQQLERLAADQLWWEDARQTLSELQSESTTSFVASTLQLSTAPNNRSPYQTPLPAGLRRAAGMRLRTARIVTAFGLLLIASVMLVGTWWMLLPRQPSPPSAHATKQPSPAYPFKENNLVNTNASPMLETWDSTELERLLLVSEQELSRLSQEFQVGDTQK